MAFGEVTLRRPRTPGRLVDTNEGIVSYRRPDPGAAFPTDINFSPSMIGIDFVSTDNIELQTIIAEHVAWVESTPIDYKVDSAGGLDATLRWLDENADPYSQISVDGSFGLFFESKFRVTMMAKDALLSPTVEAYVFLDTFVGPNATVVAFDVVGDLYSAVNLWADSTVSFGAQLIAQSASREAQLMLGHTVGFINLLAVGDVTAKLRLGYGNLAGSGIVDYINGNLVFTGNKYTAHNGGGQGAYVGHRANTQAAGNAWGSQVNWRHVRSDSAGTAVVPGSVTLGTPAVNVNADTPQVRFLQASGGMFTVNGTAAGVTDYHNSLVVN
jgi:hypothetical protein